MHVVVMANILDKPISVEYDVSDIQTVLNLLFIQFSFSRMVRSSLLEIIEND